MPSSYSLGSQFETFVREQVETGRYQSASEVIRAGLRLLQDQEELRARRLADLDRLLDEGLESARKGPLVAADEVFGRLEKRLRRRVESGKK